MTVFWGLMIPLAGTTLGSACVFFLKDKLNELLQKGLLGFASGVMVAASVWSLLIPSMDMAAGMGRLAFVPAAAGMLLGMVFLLGMDRVIPHLHLGTQEAEGPKTSLKKTTMLVLAVTPVSYTHLTLPGLPPPERFHWRSELRSKTSRRVQSFRCR